MYRLSKLDSTNPTQTLEVPTAPLAYESLGFMLSVHPICQDGHTVFANSDTWAKLLDVAKFRASHTDEWRMLLESLASYLPTALP